MSIFKKFKDIFIIAEDEAVATVSDTQASQGTIVSSAANTVVINQEDVKRYKLAIVSVLEGGEKDEGIDYADLAGNAADLLTAQLQPNQTAAIKSAFLTTKMIKSDLTLEFFVESALRYRGKFVSKRDAIAKEAEMVTNATVSTLHTKQDDAVEAVSAARLRIEQLKAEIAMLEEKVLTEQKVADSVNDEVATVLAANASSVAALDEALSSFTTLIDEHLTALGQLKDPNAATTDKVA